MIGVWCHLPQVPNLPALFCKINLNTHRYQYWYNKLHNEYTMLLCVIQFPGMTTNCWPVEPEHTVSNKRFANECKFSRVVYRAVECSIAVLNIPADSLIKSMISISRECGFFPLLYLSSNCSQPLVLTVGLKDLLSDRCPCRIYCHERPVIISVNSLWAKGICHWVVCLMFSWSFSHKSLAVWKYPSAMATQCNSWSK